MACMANKLQNDRVDAWLIDRLPPMNHLLSLDAKSATNVVQFCARLRHLDGYELMMRHKDRDVAMLFAWFAHSIAPHESGPRGVWKKMKRNLPTTFTSKDANDIARNLRVFVSSYADFQQLVDIIAKTARGGALTCEVASHLLCTVLFRVMTQGGRLAAIKFMEAKLPMLSALPVVKIVSYAVGASESTVRPVITDEQFRGKDAVLVVSALATCFVDYRGTQRAKWALGCLLHANVVAAKVRLDESTGKVDFHIKDLDAADILAPLICRRELRKWPPEATIVVGKGNHAKATERGRLARSVVQWLREAIIGQCDCPEVKIDVELAELQGLFKDERVYEAIYAALERRRNAAGW
jgi:hypothetical protein